MKELFEKRIVEIEDIKIENIKIKKYINEFWTSKQRQSNGIHEISYRACFKAQLPNFFIKNLTEEYDTVYDPFAGRGTTLIEAALLKRKIVGNDINPLSKILSEPRLLIPSYSELDKYLSNIPLKNNLKADIDLSMFYHPKTESELISLKNFLLSKEANQNMTFLDKWIRMIATNRLTGHSKGFFSVYTMPPNKAVTQESQLKINKKRNQKPEYRNVKELILKKTKSLIRNIDDYDRNNLLDIYNSSIFICKDARYTNEIKDNSIDLVVTSPPFLNIVQYATDNWLRCWFNGINSKNIEITMSKTLDDWSEVMQNVFFELYRITKPNGYIAFEVGEIKNGKLKLDETVVVLGKKAKFKPLAIIINKQNFTKTSNIWGVKNNSKGTNSNRIVLFKKEI